MARQKKQPNCELLETVKMADKAGLSYGKFVEKKYLEKQMNEKQNERQAEYIRLACKENGLAGSITWFPKEIKPTTPAQKIMVEIVNRPTFPAKCSFMYCDELDMCFFYGPDGSARCSYSGEAKVGSKDIRQNIVKAFKTAEKVLNRMQALISHNEQWKEQTS